MNKLRLFLSIALLTGLSSCDKAKSGSDHAPPEEEAKTTTDVTPKVTTPTQKAAGTAGSVGDAAGRYTIEGTHTQIIFKVNHMGASNQYGMFVGVEGSFSLDADPTASEISLTVPTDSVFTADKKRDDHLKSPDFFDAKQFPTITFKSSSVKATGDGTYSVAGDLMLHGVTKPLTIAMTHGGAGTDPEMMGGKFRTGFNGKATFKRSDFGMNFMVGAGLGDEVTLLLSLEGTRD
jgi:polyisoprenoid-binding protein YceI